jgi:antitoxin VapB
MALSIGNPETERLVTALARMTGGSKADAVPKAVRDRLEAVRRDRQRESLWDPLAALVARCRTLPVLDARPADDIIGYDAMGMPR